MSSPPVGGASPDPSVLGRDRLLSKNREGGGAAEYRTNPERPEQRRGGGATVAAYGELHQVGHVAGMCQRHTDPSPIDARSKLDALTKGD
jgi:hypothetical protein